MSRPLCLRDAVRRVRGGGTQVTTVPMAVANVAIIGTWQATGILPAIAIHRTKESWAIELRNETFSFPGSEERRR